MNLLKILQFFDDNTYNEKFIKDFVIKVKEDFIKKELKKFKSRKADGDFIAEAAIEDTKSLAATPIGVSKKKNVMEEYMNNRNQDRCPKCDRRDAACYCT
tara:strand:+ start:211 stop:510 length:300 start_codon:yes stop_codon:yes gene_type:complete